MATETLRQDLVELSRQLGLESRQLAILGEGNTSTDCGDGTFLVKASGSSLGSLEPTDLSQVNMAYVQDLLKREHMSEQDIEDELRASLVNKNEKKPSVETFLHALCLTLGEAHWVGHTHTVSVNHFYARARVQQHLSSIFFPT